MIHVRLVNRAWPSGLCFLVSLFLYIVGNHNPIGLIKTLNHISDDKLNVSPYLYVWLKSMIYHSSSTVLESTHLILAQ